MRVAVLPREVAARVITSGIARAAWAISATSLLLTVPMLTDYLAVQGELDALPIPLLILVGMLGLAVLGAVRPTPLVASAFLLVGAVGAVLYQVILLAALPTSADEALVLLNRPAVSLVLIGVQSTTTLAAVAWTLVGYLISTGVSFTVAGIVERPVVTGWGPALLLLLYITAHLVLSTIQRRARRLVPDFEELERETRRLEVEENLRARMTATMHDTLLNDLSLVMNGPDELSDRAVRHLRDDVAKLTSSEWRSAAADVVVDEQDVELRNRVMRLISDLQWRGLTVRVTGSGTGVYRLAPEVAEAMLDATRAALENVLRHSGATVAELDLTYEADRISIMVSDQGVGFDPDAVPDDRLGVRGSIKRRIRAVGGDVKLWSARGTGTTVILSVPVLERVTEHEEAEHREA